MTIQHLLYTNNFIAINNSSCIDSVSYDQTNKVLLVKFLNNRIYEYSQVELHEYGELLSAESHGKYLINIKKTRPVKEIFYGLVGTITSKNKKFVLLSDKRIVVDSYIIDFCYPDSYPPHAIYSILNKKLLEEKPYIEPKLNSTLITSLLKLRLEEVNKTNNGYNTHPKTKEFQQW